MISPTLPHSEEAERAALACALLSPDLVPLIAGALDDPEDFHLHRHRVIWRAMLKLHGEGVAIDLRTVQAHADGDFGGVAYLAGLDMDLPDLSAWESYAAIVRDYAARRSMIVECEKLIQHARDGIGADAVLEQAEGVVRDLTLRGTSKHLVPWADAEEAAVATMEDRKGGLLGPTSGFLHWDLMTQGLTPGALIVVGARPSVGKTSFGLQVAAHVAFRERLPVLVFSLEMTREELVQRILSVETGIPLADVRTSRLSERDWESIHETRHRHRNAALYLDDGAAPSVMEMAAKARRVAAKHGGLGLIMLDYFQLMRGDSNAENRNLQLTAVSMALKQMAKELQVPVLCLAQLNRKSEARGGDRRPQLSDLRDCGALEQDADMVGFLHREERYSPTVESVGRAELIVRKHRNGPCGTVELAFLEGHACFGDLRSVA